MTPEILNRLSMWGTIAIVVVAGFVFAGRWAFGDTNEAHDGPVISHLAAPESSSMTGPPVSVAATEAPELIDTTTTEPRPSIVLGEHVERTGVEEPGTTAAPTTAAPTTPVPPGTATSTTTVAAPPEAEPVAVTPPTPPVPTTTTLPATTTTMLPTTTTSTTTPSTTTTVVSDLPGIFLERFDGQPQGDSDEWSVRLEVTLGGTVLGTYRGQVFVSWSGDGSGSVVLNTGGSGKASATVGPFSGGPVTLRITNAQAAGWIYMPSLNQATTTLTIASPDDD